MTTTFDRVCACIATMPAFMKNRQTVTPDTTVIGDLDFDNIDQVELAMGLEDEFDIEITDEDAEACKTVADVVALVDRLTGATVG